MRNVIWFIVFLIFTFFVNVVFFYVSEDYRNFLKWFKSEEIVKEVWEEKPIQVQRDDDILEIVKEDDLTTIAPNNKNEEIFTQKEDNKVEVKKEIVLWRNYRDILKLFTNYDLKELEINTALFDITTEYPDNYIEYYSKGLTIYFFPTRSYNEIYDMFKVLEYEFPFKINPINNFWDNSFYINLNNDIDDNIIRIVVSNKWITFWLKIKKNEYNLVKEKLNTLKANN
jgi:hypothetical protein